MRCWESAEEGAATQCRDQEEYDRVQKICDHLGFPVKQICVVREFWDKVFSQTMRGYERGLTPNPDIMCNMHIKFGHVMEQIPEDALIATGHCGFCAR